MIQQWNEAFAQIAAGNLLKAGPNTSRDASSIKQIDENIQDVLTSAADMTSAIVCCKTFFYSFIIFSAASLCLYSCC